jgi:NAD(P)H-dependent FMN reductase
VQVLMLCGSLRATSTNAAALRTAVAVAPPGTELHLYDGVRDLPAFDTDDDHAPLPAAVQALRDAVLSADALLVSTPEYAGALPGAFKNALDWLIGEDRPGGLHGKPVGWLNPSGTGAPDAYASLRKVLGYAGAVVVEGACVRVPTSGPMVGDHGLVADPEIRAAIAAALDALVAAASG